VHGRLTLFRSVAGCVLAILGVFCVWLTLGGSTVYADHAVTDVLLVLASLAAAAACGWRSRNCGVGKLAWVWIAIACGVWAAGALVWGWYELARGTYSPSPSLADLGFVGYSLPAVLGLMALPLRGAAAGPRTRLVLDEPVTFLALFFISWVIVLQPILEHVAGRVSALALIDSLLYPVADIAISAVVFARAMRAATGQRGCWLLLGGGFLTLSVTDTIYVHDVLEGTFHVGGLLDAGWVGAFALVGLAALVPQSREALAARLNVLQESLPYLPVLLAVLVIAVDRPGCHPRTRPCGSVPPCWSRSPPATSLRPKTTSSWRATSSTSSPSARQSSRTKPFTTLSPVCPTAPDLLRRRTSNWPP
jgi:two-component system sensor histidine kinase/response regulator